MTVAWTMEDIATEYRYGLTVVRKIVLQPGFPAPVERSPKRLWNTDEVMSWAVSKRETAQRAPERTALYRHFDADNRLLYVGIARDHLKRLYTHTAYSQWRDSIARIEIEWHESRSAAEEAELGAIVNEAPLHNIFGKPQ